MTQPPRKLEEKIFYQVLEAPPVQREAYLKEACGGDQELYNRVEALLQANDLQDGFLRSPILDCPSSLENGPSMEGPGATIGRYKILERIGEGGMAVVYMAEQQEPIRRKVALKIIKLGMDTNSVIARFEAERQALAMMDHPNIAKVLDAGATDTGRPYFVMELVKGASITDFCDANSLSTTERLKLFVQVCQAVQHAHQKGIIHRDIKPSNVMVTLHDGVPVPKVIDFGIAKAVNQKLTEKTLFTRYAHIIGTPAYMSPEQAELSGLDIDTRTDIYSLGVLLYELLTGTTPFSEEELRKAGYIEMQRVIRDQEPPKPSTKLSSLGETLTDIAKFHSSTPDLLTKEIRGDLDWIVMKTMEKARDRRYDNVSSLSMDVQRHIDDEPILARPPSTTYRLGKFLRRHRTESLALVAILLLVGTLIIFVSLWSHKRDQFEEADSSRHRNILDQARQSYARQDLVVALTALKSILTSKHVGPEARVLHERILRDGQEQVHYYTREIEADPNDAESYLHRARHYHYMGNQRAFLADMDRYVAILNPSVGTTSHDDWFHHFLAGLWDSTPTNLGPIVNSPYDESVASISPDSLSPFFVSDRPGGCGALDLWNTKRPTSSDPWSTPVNLGPPVNSPYDDGVASLSADGLSLFFVSERPGGLGRGDIWVSTRRTPDDPWGTPKNLGTPVNSQSHDWGPIISTDGLSLFFDSNHPGGRGRADIWVTRRTNASAPWSEPENLGPTVNSSATDGAVSISADGLTLFFISDRPGGFGREDIWVTRRSTKNAPWSLPINLGPTINTPYREGAPRISADGMELYFDDTQTPRPLGFGGSDLWQVKIVPVTESSQRGSSPGVVQKPVEGNDGKEVVQAKN
ncbi:MAG: protein kinase [Sedimentisphaerales bacterium]